jgi:hypothetical protein
MISPLDGPRLTLVPSAAATASSWTVGRLLRAVVEARSPEGAVTLRVGGFLLEARSELPLRPGQSLTLQVAAGGPLTVLRVVPEATTDTAETDAINRALRQALPRQGEIRPLLDALAGLTRAPGLLPPAATALADRLLSNLPPVQTLTDASALKQAMLDSGQFLEARLARGDAAPTRDLKAMLLQLQTLLRDAPSAPARGDAPGNIPPAADTEGAAIAGLQQCTEAALARLVLNQIDSLPRDASAATPLVVELPLRWGERPGVLRLHIEPDDAARRETRAAPGWTVWLSLEPGDLGPVHCRLQLSGECVSTAFWAEREATAALLRDNLDELQAGLQREGLTPGHLHCQAGTPPQAARPAPRAVLDERA